MVGGWMFERIVWFLMELHWLIERRLLMSLVLNFYQTYSFLILWLWIRSSMIFFTFYDSAKLFHFPCVTESLWLVLLAALFCSYLHDRGIILFGNIMIMMWNQIHLLQRFQKIYGENSGSQVHCEGVKKQLWRAWLELLPVCASLYLHSMKMKSFCPYCASEPKTVQDTLLFYHVIKRLWFASPLGVVTWQRSLLIFMFSCRILWHMLILIELIILLLCCILFCRLGTNFFFLSRIVLFWIMCFTMLHLFPMWRCKHMSVSLRQRHWSIGSIIVEGFSSSTLMHLFQIRVWHTLGVLFVILMVTF